jgi:hypothetical protein
VSAFVVELDEGDDLALAAEALRSSAATRRKVAVKAAGELSRTTAADTAEYAEGALLVTHYLGEADVLEVVAAALEDAAPPTAAVPAADEENVAARLARLALRTPAVPATQPPPAPRSAVADLAALGMRAVQVGGAMVFVPTPLGARAEAEADTEADVDELLRRENGA